MKEKTKAILHAIGVAIFRSLRGGSVLQAQAVAFNMFVAFFPAIVFLAGVLAYADPGLEDLLRGLRAVLPPGSRRAVVESLLALSERPGRLLLIGSVGTVLLGSQLMFSLTRIFASITGKPDRRTFWQYQFRSLVMVFVTVIPWVAVSLLLVFGKFVRSWMIEELGVEFSLPLQALWSFGYSALDRRGRWDDVIPGAALAIALWWIVTSAFGYYVRRLAIYNLLYGGFAAAIGLLVWMYLSAVVILIGES
jgi:membrane protein